MTHTPLRLVLLATALLLAACGSSDPAAESLPPTATLAPVVSMTPRFTATPVASRTPLPTFTLTPSETPIPPTPSDTFTPSPTPPILGIVASINTVNVREGPGVSFSAFEALRPGTSVQVLGRNTDETWINIRLEDGREGWIAAQLLRLQETATPVPTATLTPDLTALAQGTPLPTAILGGGTVTPTPPRSVVSPTPVTAQPDSAATTPDGSPTSFLPVIDVDAINQTATALAGGIVAPTSSPTLPPTTAMTQSAAATQPAGAGPTATRPTVVVGEGEASEGDTSAQQGVDVLAYCDEPVHGHPPPTDLVAGSTIDIWWSWYARTEAQIQEHLDNVIYEVAINGTPLADWRQYRVPTRRENDGNYYAYWYVPAGPLPAGDYEITYRVTWRNAISDGYDTFGPGTRNPVQTGSCTFTVR